MSSSVLRSSWFLLLLWGVVSLAPLRCSAQGYGKRIILKDGSYQVVTKWEVQGDRVHYYSAERGVWEDLPSSMVDWDATNQYERDLKAHKSARGAELDKELAEALQEEEAKSPHVAPGLRLPSEGGVYVLDTYLSEPQLVPLDQSTGEVNRHVGRNVLRAAINPVSGAKQTIELAGPSAKVQVHASVPAFYVNLDPEEEEAATDSSNKSSQELPWDRFRVLRVQVKGDKRIVGAIKTAVYGKVTQEQQSVAATAERLGEGWVKITPKEPLQPGEYALAEMLGKEGMNSYVWDFGIHASAPANLAVIRPDPAELKRSAGQSEGSKKPEP
jgi:hypothetical protein